MPDDTPPRPPPHKPTGVHGGRGYHPHPRCLAVASGEAPCTCAAERHRDRLRSSSPLTFLLET